MYRTVIEKYAKKGWLKYGIRSFNSMDRLWAALLLQRDYINSRESSVGIVNPMVPKVDGGKDEFGLRGNLRAKNNFLKAFSALLPRWRDLIETVVLENCELDISTLRNAASLKNAKKELSAALDCLVLYYMSREEKQADDEKCFR